VPTFVFSTTLDRVEGRAQLVTGDIAEAVAELKAQPGKDMIVGGAGLGATIKRIGLIDEYRLYVHPVVLGSGRVTRAGLTRMVSMKKSERGQDDLPNIGAPATRALEAIGISRLSQLTKMTEAAIADLHGVGPRAIRILNDALQARGLAFAEQKPDKSTTRAAGASSQQVDEYLAKLPADKRAALQKLRKQIHKPGAKRS
jgi:hypothetical protein